MNLLSDLRVLNDGVSTVGGQYLNNNLGGLDVINVNLLNRNGGRNSSGNLSGNSSGGRNSSGGNLNRNSYGDQLNPLNGNSKNNNARNHSLVPQIHANMPPIRKSNRKALLIPPPQIAYSTTNSTISTLHLIRLHLIPLHLNRNFSNGLKGLNGPTTLNPITFNPNTSNPNTISISNSRYFK